MKASSLGGPKPQFVDANGNPYSGAKLFFYAAGSSTKQNTYRDSTGATPNSNPIVLDSSGRPTYEIWFTDGLTYKAVLAPSTDSDPPNSPIFTVDNLAGINDVTASVDEWQASGLTPTYVGATSFTVSGDQTATFTAGRRLKSTNTAGTIYSTVSTSSYNGGTGLTTVTIINDSGTLDSGLSSVSVSILRADNPSLPAVRYYHADGTVSLPSVTFLNDKDCGVYRIGTNNLGVAVNGAKVLDISTSGLSVTSALAATGTITGSVGLNAYGDATASTKILVGSTINATGSNVDVFRWLTSAGSVQNMSIVGHLYCNAVDNSSGANQAQYIYYIMSAANGASSYTLAKVAANVRGTDVGSSADPFSIVADGGGGGVKLRFDKNAGITQVNVNVQFVGLIAP